MRSGTYNVFTPELLETVTEAMRLLIGNCNYPWMKALYYFTDLSMRPSHALQSHREAVRWIVLQHHGRNVRVFGSVMRGEDTEDSDLDLLIEPTQETTLMDVGAIRFELRKLLGISVDVLTPKALPDHFREQVLLEAVPV